MIATDSIDPVYMAQASSRWSLMASQRALMAAAIHAMTKWEAHSHISKVSMLLPLLPCVLSQVQGPAIDALHW